ncbi:MAG: 2-nitropropane dioxygenase [Parcubacteria group bacterium Athens1014_10]|nr:MAG: 2-nitropropane dioxygenase [Parcubacteria group bacterium Athens1014_10]TSD05170.1 MAG: 2-nitropropane dioxygenase [Parcubacteria group bacterium Athens0714_12]
MLPKMKIGKLVFEPIIQGGMGAGVSLAPLASAVSALGGLGTVAGAGIDRLVSERIGRKVNSREAAAIEISEAKKCGKPIAINVMVALVDSYNEVVLGALDGGVDVIISGAGPPLMLPSVVASHQRGKEVALIPIVSSGRFLRLLCKRWERMGHIPDAVVVEGPLAGGHLGWRKIEEIENPDNALEKILPECVEVAKEFGGFPIIAAGGIDCKEEIARFLSLGAAGVQIATRFLATKESSASEDYKQAVLKCKKEDIIVTMMSPCGLPFRTLKNCPMYEGVASGRHKTVCNKGYVLLRGKCLAKSDGKHFFCLCNGLFSSAGYSYEGTPPLYTVGAKAYLIDKISTTEEVMNELTN